MALGTWLTVLWGIWAFVGKSISPVLMGHKPFKVASLHGLMVFLYTERPYPMRSNSSVTFPEICDTPLMLTASVPLSGVKTTSKSVAEKLELSMHGFNELDSNMRMADASGRMAESKVRSSESGAMVSKRRVVMEN